MRNTAIATICCFFSLTSLFFIENAAGQSCSSACPAFHWELHDCAHSAPPLHGAADKSMMSVFSGTVQHPNGVVQYSKMLIYDPVTLEIISSDWVCNGGNPFSIPVPPGVYNVYYRPFAFGAKPYEALNVDLTSNLDTVLVLTPYTTPAYMSGLSWSKMAIFADNLETVSITAQSNSAHPVDEVYWFNEFNLFINPAVPYPQAKIPLYDDGLGADLVAGDGLYTSIPIKYNPNGGLYRSGNLSSAFSVFFQVEDAVNGWTGYAFGGTAGRLGLVNPNATPIQPLAQVNNNVYVNDYLVNIVRTQGYNHIGDAQNLYAIFPDSFDFINIFHTNYTGSNPNTNFHFNVKNDVSGIGVSLFDNTAQYGSTGRLQGINVFPSLSPEPPLNHEVLHQWCNFMPALFNSNAFGSHNGYSTIHGVHGGIVPPFTINSPTSVSFNQAVTFGYSSDQKTFGLMELYMMGAVDTNAIEDYLYNIYNPVYQGGNNYNVSSIDTITPQDIVNAYGYRSPSPQVADTDFKTANIVISDAPLTDAAIAFYTYLAKAWADEIPEFFYQSFKEAALSNATMQTLLLPLCPAITGPVNGATDVPYNAMVQWQTAPGGAGYIIRAGTTPGGTDILDNLDVGNVLSYDPPADFPYNDTVYLSVTSYNALGDEAACTEISFETGPEPDFPDCTQLVSPANGATNVPAAAALIWAPASGNPSGYRLNVGTTPGGTDILNNFDVGNLTTYDPPGNFPFEASIYVTIIPYKPTGMAFGCLEESFTTQSPPPACTNLSNPVNGAVGVPLTSSLAWTPASGNPTGYILDVGTTPGGTDILDNFDVGNVTTYDPPGIFPINTTIYVRINPYHASGQAMGCAVESFTTENGGCLTTFFNSNNGFHGNMFNVTNTTGQNLQINSFEVNVDNPGTSAVILVYYTTSASTFLGNQSNPSAWTLLGSATVTSQGSNQPTPVPIGGLVLAPGQSKGLYVTTNGATIMRYTNGTSATPDTDGNLVIDLSNNPIGNAYPFTNNNFGRRWNGTICYALLPSPPACTGLTTPANAATNVPANTPLSWSVASGSPTGYRLDVGTTPGGTDILNNFDVGNVTTYNPPGLFPYGSTVYVTVKPYNSGGMATGCTAESFTTGNCIANLTISGTTVEPGVYKSLGEMSSWSSTVATGTEVTFHSDTAILLDYDFTVEPGGILTLEIMTCPVNLTEILPDRD